MVKVLDHTEFLMIRSTALDTRFQAVFTNGSFSATADVPMEKGGSGNGFGPHELLEAALVIPINKTEPNSIANEEPFGPMVMDCLGRRARVTQLGRRFFRME